MPPEGLAARLADAARLRPDVFALAFLPLLVLGIHRMRSPETAARGNALGAAGMLAFIGVTLAGQGRWANPAAWVWLAAGAGAGIGLAIRIRMIRMPELVALFNGIGGAASAIVALLALTGAAADEPATLRTAALLAVGIGALTFSGSAVAGLKLSRRIGARPLILPLHSLLCTALLAAALGLVIGGGGAWGDPLLWRGCAWGILVLSLVFGMVFMIRVGGADMPVSISLLNALTGIAAAVTGYAVGSPVPVAVGALVGAAGLMLTAIMCRAMNRRLGDVLTGRTTGSAPDPSGPAPEPPTGPGTPKDPASLLAAAKRVAIVPGYGMALAQAQQAVKRLFDVLETRGAEVFFAIHPVAGRMPGHMHILLAEVDLPYDRFCELDDANARLGEVDAALVVGANDVVNPAANRTENTPISGMPVLNVEKARAVIVCNLDRSPGYAGVPNPLYDGPKTTLCLGDAAETVARLADALA